MDLGPLGPANNPFANYTPTDSIVDTDPAEANRKKISIGLGRNESYSGDGSGDIFTPFSTGNPGAVSTKGLHQLTMLPNDLLDPHFPGHCASNGRGRH